MQHDPGTRAAILELAQELAQQHGYNGFSFHELARQIGIKTASVHHHFARKEDLGRELACRYRERFCDALTQLDRLPDPTQRLKRFVGLFEKTLASGNKLCLCGMLGSEYATLPDAMRAEVAAFFTAVEAWLSKTLDQGRATGALQFEGSSMAAARGVLAALEGAMIAARALGDSRRLSSCGAWLLRAVVGGSRAAVPAAQPSPAVRPRGDHAGARSRKARSVHGQVRR